MATEQLQHIDDPTADLPEPRSLGAIERDVHDVERNDLRSITGELDTVRQRASMHVGDLKPGGDAWRAAVDEYVGHLDPLEVDVITRLQAIQTRLQADRAALNDVPYRPALSPDDTAAADAKAAALQSRLASMDAAGVARAMRGALLFGDPVECAAWALCAEAIAQRFPSATRVRDDRGREVSPASLFGDPIRQLQRATGDRRAIEALDRVEGQARRIGELVSELTQARAAHDPDNAVGSPLLTWEFGARSGAGHEASRRARRYDPALVARRLGRR